MFSAVAMAFYSVFPAPTHLNKTARPSELFVQPMMLFVPYYFKPLFLVLFGLKLYTLPPISLTLDQPIHITLLHPSFSSTVIILGIMISVFLDAFVIPTP